MFIATLFTRTKIWKQPKCPRKDDRIKKVWFTHTVGYDSAIKRREILPFATRGMDLEDIILSEISFPGGSAVKNLPAMQETQEIQIQSLGREIS